MQLAQTDDKMVSLNALDNEEKVLPDQVKVLVGGFPLGSKISEIRKFLCKRFPVRRINIATDKKNKFYGFVFIKFDKREQAEQFTKEDLFFEGVQLDVKLAVNNFQFIEECIQNMRTPNKVFIDNIPRNYTKRDVFNVFNKYGKVIDVICVSKKERTSTFAYVTFEDSNVAKDCVNSVVKGICGKVQLRVEYGNPKFSAKMLNKIHPVLRNYISEIQDNIKNFNPKDFDQLCVGLIETKQDFLVESTEEVNNGYKKEQKKYNKLAKKFEYGQNFDYYGEHYFGNEATYMGNNCYGSYGNFFDNYSYNYSQNSYNSQDNNYIFNGVNNYSNQEQMQSLGHMEHNYSEQQQYYNENQAQDCNSQQYVQSDNTPDNNSFSSYDQNFGYCNYDYNKNYQDNHSGENIGYYANFNNVDPNIQSQFNNNGLVSDQSECQYNLNQQTNYDYYSCQNYNSYNDGQSLNTDYNNLYQYSDANESNTNYSNPNSYIQNSDLNQYQMSTYDNQDLSNDKNYYAYEQNSILPNQETTTDQIKDELVCEQHQIADS